MENVSIWRRHHAVGLCNIGYTSEMHLKPKSSKISFSVNLYINGPIIYKLCKAHGSITAVLYWKFQNDWTIETNLMGVQDFKRFGFKTNFGWIRYIPYCTRPQGYLACHCHGTSCIVTYCIVFIRLGAYRWHALLFIFSCLCSHHEVIIQLHILSLDNVGQLIPIIGQWATLQR